MLRLFLLMLPFFMEQPATSDAANTWRKLNRRCELPVLPANGQYFLDNQKTRAEPGHQVAKGTVLRYTCSPGYFLSVEFSVCQGSNQWKPMPTCAKNCTLYGSYTVDYSCYYPQRPGAACQPSMPHGSSVVFKCKAGHALSGTQVLGEMSCQNGTWSLSVPECEPVCGLDVADGRTLIKHAPVAKKNTLPWHVAVYQKQGSNIGFICGGTLVSSRLVVGAAHCYYNPYSESNYPAQQFYVAANKHYQAWDHPEEVNAPKSEVRDIRIHDWYRGEKQHHQNDIALLVLKTPFQFTDRVASICFDVTSLNFDNLQLSSNSMGKFAGWGLTETQQPAEELRVLSVPFIDHRKCVEEFKKYNSDTYITEDKICAGSLDGPTACPGDSGAGLVFPDQQKGEERWYLRGILSVAPRDHAQFSCRFDTYTAFTRLFVVGNWFKEQFNDASSLREVYRDPDVASQVEPIDNLGCPLPEIPTHGRYSIAGQSKKAIVPGEVVEPSTLLRYYCDADYRISIPTPVVVVECQENASWSFSPVCEKVSTQDDISTSTPAPSIDGSKCILPPYPANGNFTVTEDDIIRDLLPGTIVEEYTFIAYSCHQDYELSNMNMFSLCEEGKWNCKLPTCIKKCPMLSSLTVDFSCTNRRNKTIPCPRLLKSHPQLQSPEHGAPGGLSVLTCGHDGRWDYPRPACIPVCGLENVVGADRSHNKRAPKGSFPWNVGLYTMKNNSKDEPSFICGGSLIYPNIIISAAHCFQEYQQKPEIDSLMVAAGKFLRFWDKDLDENLKTIQKSKVANIYMHEAYKLSVMQNKHSYDIALLQLTTPFELSAAVLPICLDLRSAIQNSHQTEAGKIGRLAGWGATEKRKLSDELKQMELKVMTVAECSDGVDRDYFTKNWFSADSICVGNITKDSLPGDGDSGGGLTFNAEDDDDKRWFLRGVCRSSLVVYHVNDTRCSTRCRGPKYMTFTSIFRHRDWLAENIKHILQEDYEIFEEMSKFEGNAASKHLVDLGDLVI